MGLPYNISDYSIKAYSSSLVGGKAITPVDALMVNRAYIGSYTISNVLEKKAADVNIDTKVTPTDALMINRKYIKVYTFSDLFKQSAADVNADGKINPKLR